MKTNNGNTRVDDMLIEMISPKMKEIEENFSNNKPLSQDDINTLLLKSQYNHINHLDIKLDEVTADVASLRDDFSDLKGEFALLRSEFALLRSEFALLKSEIHSKFDLLEERMERTIQTALNKNMLTLVLVMGAFLSLSKIIDKF